MVVGTSALVAVLQDEPERPALRDAMAASTCRLSTATLIEAGIVMQGRHGDGGTQRLDALLTQVGAEAIPPVED